MEEVFQNYKHYSEWMLKNWNSDKYLDELIISYGLMIKKEISASGMSFRQLSKVEFCNKELNGFIRIPKITIATTKTI